MVSRAMKNAILRFEPFGYSSDVEGEAAVCLIQERRDHRHENHR